MKFYSREFELTTENIVSVRNECAEAYTRHAGKRGNDELVMALELTIEEHLVRFLNIYGENAKCRMVGIKFLGTIHFELTEFGEEKNPLQTVLSENEYSDRILSHYGEAPSYSYKSRQNANIIIFHARMLPIKRKMLKMILGAALLAIITALIFHFLPGSAGEYINANIIGPIFTKLTAIIAAVATPLVFFGVISGITGIGSSSAVSHMGKKMLRNMGLTYLVTAIVFSLFIVLFYPISLLNSAAEGDVLQQLVQLVLDIFPSNLLEGFLLDNDLQVIVLAIFIGIILVGMGQKAAKINQAIESIDDVVNKMMAVVCETLPLIVYLGILNMLLSDVSGLSQLYKVALGLLLTGLLLILYMLIRIKRKFHISIRTLFKKQLPTLMINLTTSSQVAALPENMKCCIEKFGIDAKFVNLGLPVGIVAYMPAGAAFLGLTACGVANMSGVVLTPGDIIKLALVSVIVAIAAPPIPGSAFAVMPIIFSSCNIPMTYYSVAIVSGTILGYFLPAINGYLMQLELLLAAKDLKLVDEDILYKPEQELSN